MTLIAERTGWSRQHVANVLDAYFRPADDSDLAAALETIAPGGRGESYRDGYRDGFADGARFAVENLETLRELVDERGE